MKGFIGAAVAFISIQCAFGGQIRGLQDGEEIKCHDLETRDECQDYKACAWNLANDYCGNVEEERPCPGYQAEGGCMRQKHRCIWQKNHCWDLDNEHKGTLAPKLERQDDEVKEKVVGFPS